MRFCWFIFYTILISYSCSFRLAVAMDVITSSEGLVQKLCNSTDKDRMMLLNSSILYDISGDDSFCIVNNANIYISSQNSERVHISCSQTLKEYPTKGIAFVDSTVTINSITITNCGALLTALPDNITVMFNSSSLYYPTHYSAALLFINSQVEMENVKLTSSYGFAVLGINLDNSVINNCSFASFLSFLVNIKQDIVIGNGLLLHFLNDDATFVSSKNVTISKGRLIWNTAHSTSTSIGQCIDDIYGKDDAPKPVMFSAGITILYTHKKYEAKVTLTDINFSNNIAPFTTSLLILHYRSLQNDQTEMNSITLKTLSIYNEAVCPESAEFSFIYFPPYRNSNMTIKTYSPLAIHNSIFRSQPQHLEFVTYPMLKNTIYIGVQDKTPQTNIVILFNNSGFWENFASGHGACINVFSKLAMTVIFNSVDFHKNRVKMVSQIASSSGIITLRGDIDLIINGTEMYPSVFKSNYGRVIHTFNETNLYLHGHVVFKSNKALSGAAINLQGNSQLHFMKKSSILFEENQSVGLGGAIYAVAKGRHNECVLLFENSTVADTINISFISNSALNGGNNIYAYPIFNCNNGLADQAGIDSYENIFNYKTNSSKILQLSTLPSNFSIIHFNQSGTTVYPGQVFYACIAAFDILRRRVYGTARINILPGEEDELSNRDRLASGSDEQVVEENEQCTNVSIKLHSTTQDIIKSRNIMLYLKETAQYHVFPIFLHDCPLGFKLDISMGLCVCSQVLVKNNMKCSIQTQTFSKLDQTNQWVGVVTKHNQSIFGISLSCPIGYCTSNNYDMKWFYSSDKEIFLREEENSITKLPICTKGREGPLCSKCSDGFTTAFGSNKCVHCNHNTYYWLAALLVLLLGPILILILFLLKLTLTAGTLNGIIFYANFVNTGVLQVLSKDNTNHTQSIFNDIILGILSILNLEYGFPVCFIKGMDQFWRVGLSLLFPYYLLLLVGAIILISRCSTCVSRHTSHSSVQVLVTIVHLSFSKLLLNIVTVFSSTVIYTDDDKYKVWSFDGSIAFLTDSRHQALALITVIATVPLLSIYLCFLIFTKPLITHFSKCNLYFRPIYEAIHAPYKEGKEHWFVMRLLMLIFVCIFWSFKTPANSILVYIITTLLLCVFLFGQAIFRPYINRRFSLLDNWTLLNLIIVYIGLLLPHINNDQAAMVLFVTASMIFATFLIIIVYHLLLVTHLTKKIHKWYSSLRSSRSYLFLYKMNSFVETVGGKKRRKPPSRVMDRFDEPCDHCREPLLDDY